MGKAVKFSISVSTEEFKALEAARRESRSTRSQFIRSAILKGAVKRTPGDGSLLVREEGGDYQAPQPADITDMAELRKRAMAAAGMFASGVPDLSVEHDRYLADPEAGTKGESR
jgi:hypothetical protein